MDVDEVATVSVRTEAFVEKAEAGFCFVGSVECGIAFEFLGTMGELALVSVGTEPVKEEILAKTALGFRSSFGVIGLRLLGGGGLKLLITLIGGSVRLGLMRGENGGGVCGGVIMFLISDHC